MPVQLTKNERRQMACWAFISRTLPDYVQENSALDWEAKERGTSVYLPDRVIPMLPKELSNGMLFAKCRARPTGACRCLMDSDDKGQVTIGNYEIVEICDPCGQAHELYAGAKRFWTATKTLCGRHTADEAPMLTEMDEAFEGASAEHEKSAARWILIFRKAKIRTG